ncbi:hypothetical protein KQ873_00765 [Mycoplasma zalophidermidis]|uniref:MATE family Na+-driven efflux transporter n=1 Tax=Mycoplasma zalophidermidis TaxID=398174 RepID=UPI001C11E1BB|nr:MATE family Na+-driven efflux transporter [Mycoplasma zalophidermidis]MBU4689573.1 hypothetical protein [Mycoplasma zalophidermidis]
MINIKNIFKKIDMRMFMALLFFGALPTVYTTIRIYWIGQIPDTWSFSIASQMQWVGLLYEVLQESFILPLFFFVGGVIANKKELENRLRTGIIFAFSIYLILTIVIISAAKSLTILMSNSPSIIDKAVYYIRLESISSIINIMFKFILVALITIKKDKNIYIPLILQLILTIILDIFFVSNLSVSLKLGVNGIAISNIIVSSAMLIISLVLLEIEKINIWTLEKMDFRWFKRFLPISAISGLETLIRNLFFMFMIVKMINMVGEQGTFWVTNNFIWGWLLLPVLQLAEVVKAEVGIGKNKTIKENTLGYFAIVTIIVMIWLITIPLWKPFLKNVMGLDTYNVVYKLALISLFFYITFAFNAIIDGIFYGLGRTDYMLYQSIAVNCSFFVIMFILYKTGVWTPTLYSITLMFAGGISIDSILTYIIFAVTLKKNKINIFKILKKDYKSEDENDKTVINKDDTQVISRYSQ